MMFWIIFWYFEMDLKWYLISDLSNLFDKWKFEVYILWVYLNDIGFMKCGIFKLWNILKIEYCILWIKPIFEIFKIWNGLLVNWIWVENDGLK